MIDCKINKVLKVGTNISFIYGSKLIDGQIKEKTKLDKGDISFLIETKENSTCRIKHRYLDLYYVYNGWVYMYVFLNLNFNIY